MLKAGFTASADPTASGGTKRIESPFSCAVEDSRAAFNP
jgi:hypothetical protein